MVYGLSVKLTVAFFVVTYINISKFSPHIVIAINTVCLTQSFLY